MYRIPALGDGLLRPFECSVKSLYCLFGPPWEHVARRLKSEHEPVKTLQQRVMQIAGDARALIQTSVELLCDLMEPEPVQRPQQRQKSGRARRLEPAGLIVRRLDRKIEG